MGIKIKNYNIEDARISKELSGFRIALFSDLHDKFYGNDAKALVDKISQTKPDVAVFCGDAVTSSHNEKSDLKGHDNTVSTFKEVAKRFPVYFVTGNHERRLKKLSELAGDGLYEKLLDDLKAVGVNVLSNESALIADGKIKLFGLDLPLDYYSISHKDLMKEDIESYVGHPSNEAYNILLAHTPLFFPEYVKWGADLTFCGHIHGGFVRLPIIGGTLSPYRKFFPKYDYGYFECNDKQMIITSGAGDHNIRIKPLNPYEICLITLNSKEKS